MPKVLIVEDDEATRSGLAVNFRDDGYDVTTQPRGDAVLGTIRAERPDLIVLDVMLPEMNGFEVCRLLRSNGIGTPIILLTARTQEDDRVIGLETGADDYVTKPFSIRELLARARIQLRHRPTWPAEEPCTYRLGDVEVNFRNREVKRGSRPVVLSPREFDLLNYLIRHRRQLLSRKRLLREVWGYEQATRTRTLDTHILKLRQKLEPDPAHPSHILSVYGTGYKFID
jgi:DNA-binding response OmpR family regulator